MLTPLISRTLAGVALGLTCVVAGAQTPATTTGPIRIGFITDMSGPYADIDGSGGAVAIRMAIADFGGSVLGRKIEFVSADHQNKADVAAARAREWIDGGNAHVIIGGSNSAAALATSAVAAEKRTVYINVGAGTEALTNEQCNPFTIHYAFDNVALAKGTGSAVTARGGKSWYFVSADYAFGKSLEKNTADVVLASGGTVAGAVRHPLSAPDFSSYMLQAQASGAQVLGLANAGGDTINAIKSAREFGLTKSMTLAGLLVFITDIHTLGLDATQGMLLTDSWYWNRDERTRVWSQRFMAEVKRMPTSIQAGNYSAVLSYLAAVKAAGTTDGAQVMAQLRQRPVDDMFAKGQIRADGSMVHDMYLMQVKTPAESSGPWDYYKIVATIPGDTAFTTQKESRCAAWK